MPTTLRRILFAPRHLHRLADFDCGGEVWQREMTDWIKGGPDGVLEHQAQGGEVWLYATDAREVVGFGALGVSNWRWPTNKDRPRRVSIITALGVDRRYHGQPPGPPEQRYASQILRDLIHEASQHREREPLLGLFVHPENGRAIRFYERAGFAPFFRTYTDPESGVTYQSMLLRLPIDESPQAKV